MQLTEVLTHLSQAPRSLSELEQQWHLLVRELVLVRHVLNGRIELGFPSEGTTNGQIDNIRGSYARVVLSGAGDLGVAKTMSHNLSLPVVTVATGGRPNVRWLVVGWLYGDLTGAAAAPGAPAVNPGLSVLFKMGDTVGTSAIELRFYSTLVPAVTAPLTVDLLFTPAVQ